MTCPLSSDPKGYLPSKGRDLLELVVAPRGQAAVMNGRADLVLEFLDEFIKRFRFCCEAAANGNVSVVPIHARPSLSHSATTLKKFGLMLVNS
jgi:hypothetical protein